MQSGEAPFQMKVNAHEKAQKEERKIALTKGEIYFHEQLNIYPKNHETLIQRKQADKKDVKLKINGYISHWEHKRTQDHSNPLKKSTTP